ncbi:MAG: nucleotide exchange factor GrpE [Patescibacteria group bacterium]
MTKKNEQAKDHNDDNFVFLDETDSNEFADKIKKLQAKLKLTEEEKKGNLSGWQRAKADYSNLKANTDREKTELSAFIRAGVIEDFLPLADSFEMAMANKEVWEAVPENWRKGVEYIYQQLENIFSSNGIKSINPVGLTFDPTEHESIDIIETNITEEDNKVLIVAKLGYKLGEKILRPAQVKIGKYLEK